MEPSLVSEITEDREYMECVKDILCHPVFQSMDPVSYTHLYRHLFQCMKGNPVKQWVLSLNSPYGLEGVILSLIHI